MRRAHAIVLGALALLLGLGWFLIDRALDPDRRAARVASGELDAGTGVVGGPVAPAPPDRTAPDGVVRGDIVYTPRDLEIFEETVAWARRQRLDTLELGAIMVKVGRRFVGEPYTPHTLDLPGPERLVVNLREFDCVTFVENALAFGRIIRAGDTDFRAFTDELRRIRYRDGVIDAYPSRLHYFSEWIGDNGERGIVRDISREIGGIADREPIDFMSTHADAYVQLEGNPEWVARIREIERRLSAGPRYYVPQDRIAGVADRIRDGDVIAATSSVRGLDIAHTGLALWIDGRLHLMHAPLVGKSVEISERPLADRIARIEGQDGIMVARPL